MKKRWTGLLCLLLMALCALGWAAAENTQGVEIDIPQVQAGQETYFTFSFEQDSLQYIYCNLYVKGSEQSSLYSNYLYPSSGTTTMMERVDGYLLQPGNYTWVVEYQEYDSSETQTVRKDFTIAEGGQPEKPEVSLSSTAFYYGSDQNGRVTAPSDYRLRYIQYQYVPQGEAWEGASTQSEYIYSTGEFSLYLYGDTSETGTKNYQIRFCIQENNIWSQWSDPMDVTLTRYGDLQEPVITVAANKKTGQDIPFSIVCENVETFTASLYRVTDSDGTEWVTSLQAEDGNYTFTGTSGTIVYPITEAGTYRLDISANATGYGSASGSQTFTVGEGTLSAGPKVTLNEGGDVYAYSYPTLTATLAGMDQARVEVYYESGMRQNYYTVMAEQAGTIRSSFWAYSTGNFTLKVRGHANGKWTEATEVTYTVKEKPKLPTPTVTLSTETLEAGTDLTVTFESKAPEGVGYYYQYEMQKQEEGTENWSYVMSRGGIPSDSSQVTVDGSNLVEAGNYRISCYIYPWDSNVYNSSEYASKTFTVTAAALGKPTLTLEKKDGYYIQIPFKVNFDQNYDLIRVCAYRKGSSYVDQDLTAENSQTVEVSFYSKGEYTLKGIAKKDGHWTRWSEEIPVTITSMGKLDDGSIHLDATDIKAGYDVTGSVTVDENASSWNLNLQRKNTSGNYWEGITSFYPSDESNTFSFSGAYISAGDYRLTLDSYQNGYEPGSTSIEFTVTGSLNAGPKATAPETAYINISTQFSLNLTGATELEVRYFRDYSGYSGYYYQYASYRVQGDGSFTWSNSFNQSGTWGVRVSAKVNGQWTDWGEMVNFQVTSKGKLADPVLTLPEGEIKAGEDLDVSYTMDPNAESAYVNLYLLNGSTYESQFGQSVYDHSGTLVIGGFLMSPGHYQIQMQLRAPGYESSVVQKEFTVSGEELTGPSFTLDKDSYLAGEQAIITLDKAYETVCVSSDGNTRTFVNRSVVRWNLPNYERSDMSIRVKTQTNGVWSQWTTKTIQVKRTGVLDTPVITVEKATLGEDIQIRISQVEHADRYEINISDHNGEYIAGTYLSDGGLVTLDQMLFTSGNYSVRVWVYGKGYESSYASKEFEVTGSRSGPLPTVTAGATTVREGEMASFVVSAPGASLVIMRRDENRYQEFYTVTNDRVVIRQEIYGSETFRFAAQTNGVWSEWTEPITVSTEQEEQQYSVTLSDPVITLSAEKPATGSELKVTLKSDAKAKEYELKLLYSGDHDWGEYAYYVSGEISSAAQTVITIPGKELSRAGSYQLEVWTSAPNANTSYAAKKVRAVGSSIYAPAPTVTYGITSDTVRVGQSIDLTVTAGGKISIIEMIMTYTGYNYESTYTYSMGEYVADHTTIGYSFSEYYTGQDVTLAVRAKIDGVWSELSEERVFHVKASQGTVNYPIPVLSSTSVTAGEPITVSWSGVDSQKVAALYVNWHCGNEWNDSDRLAVSTTSYTIDTTDLQSGTYYVYIYPERASEGFTYSNNQIYASFHVKAPATGTLQTLSLPSALKVIEEEAFKGTNAQRIVIPSGCTTIGSMAFAFSDNLVSIVIPASVTAIAEDAFLGCEDITIETSSNSTAAQFASAHGMKVSIK